MRSAARPDWGVGQVQSLVGDRITVNFENAGKVVLIGSAAELTRIASDWT